MNPFRLSIWKRSTQCFFAILIIVNIFEWLVFYGYIDVLYIKYIRGFLLVLMFLIVIEASLFYRIITRFPIARSFLIIGILMGIYALLSPRFLSELYYVTRVFFWIIGCFFVYYMTFFGIITEKYLLKAISIIVLIESIFVSTYILNPRIEASQNVGIYLLVWCLPYIMLIEKTSLKNSIIVLVSFAIILSLKRGAILAMVAGFWSSTIFYYFMEKKLKAVVLSFAIFITFFIFISGTLSVLAVVKPQFLTERISDLSNYDEVDEIGSGRVGTYKKLTFKYFKSIRSNPLNFFFGFGSRSTQEFRSELKGGEFDQGKYAHSDWIQFMLDYGLLGIFSLLLLHKTIISLIIKCYSTRHPYTLPLIMCYTIMFFKNIYSGMIFFPQTIFFSIFIAYVYASLKIEIVKHKRVII